MSDPKLLRSADDLFSLLEADGVPHRSDPSRGEALIPTRLGPDEEALLALRWAQADGFVHLFQDLNTPVEPAALPAVDEAIARLNHSMPVAGFGVNSGTGRLYYRMTVPLREGGVLPDTALRALFSATVKNGADFVGVLRRVARGEISPSEVVVQAAATLTARNPSAPSA